MVHAAPRPQAVASLLHFLPVVARLSSRSTRRNAWAAGGVVTFPAKSTSRLATDDPYALAFVSLSGRRTPPDKSIPANTPCEREYARISAVRRASVAADAVRPTGPAAKEMSP